MTHRETTMRIATRFAGLPSGVVLKMVCPGGEPDAGPLHIKSVEQDWHAETTTIVFSDGSQLVCSDDVALEVVR